VWVVGSEGTGALGMMQEVALTVILDLIAKVCQTKPLHAYVCVRVVIRFTRVEPVLLQL